jgi:hypothetical protein
MAALVKAGVDVASSDPGAVIAALETLWEDGYSAAPRTIVASAAGGEPQCQRCGAGNPLCMRCSVRVATKRRLEAGAFWLTEWLLGGEEVKR